MPSTYSTNLRIELVADNEQSGIWGQTTNRNFTQVFEETITATAEVDVTAGDVTLTAVNGATDQARRPFIRVIGSPVVARQVNVPDVTKLYFVQNTTGQNVTIKPTGQTGVTLLMGQFGYVRTRTGLSAQLIELLATVSGNLTVPGTLTVGGATTLNSTLGVTGVTTINNILNVTTASGGIIRMLTANAGASGYITIGRTVTEGFIGISGTPSGITIGDVAGDLSVRNDTGPIRFAASGASAQVTISAANVSTGIPISIATGNGGITLRSNNAAQYSNINMGRTGNESTWGVAGGASTFTFGDAAGDVTIQGATRIWLTIGSTGFARIDSAGFGVLTSLNALGGFIHNNAVTGVRLGTSGVTPVIQFTSATAGADNKIWDEYADTTQLHFRTVNDGNSGANDWLTVTRATAIATSVVFPNGRVGIARTPTTQILEVSGSAAFGYTTDQAARLIHNDAYMSFWNTAASTRSGYLQMLSTGTAVWANEVGGAGAISAININGSSRLVVTGAGIVNITAGSGSLQLNGTATRAETNPGFAINSAFSFTIPRRPDAVRVALECLTAEAGYVAGQTVEIPPSRVGYTGGYWTFTNAASTNLTVQTLNATLQIPSTSGVATNVTPANWSLRVTALFL